MLIIPRGQINNESCPVGFLDKSRKYAAGNQVFMGQKKLENDFLIIMFEFSLTDTYHSLWPYSYLITRDRDTGWRKIPETSQNILKPTN